MNDCCCARSQAQNRFFTSPETNPGSPFTSSRDLRTPFYKTDGALRGFDAILRSLFAVHPDLLAPILHIIHRAIATLLIDQTGIKRDQAATGAVTLIQRFGSAANLNVHLHALVLDGVYGNPYPAGTSGKPDESMPAPAAAAPIFHAAAAPTHAAPQALLGKIITRILRLLTSGVGRAAAPARTGETGGSVSGGVRSESGLDFERAGGGVRSALGQSLRRSGIRVRRAGKKSAMLSEQWVFRDCAGV